MFYWTCQSKVSYLQPSSLSVSHIILSVLQLVVRDNKPWSLKVRDGKTNLLNATALKVLHGFCPKTSVNAPLSAILQKQTTQMTNRGPNTLTWAPVFLLSRLDFGLISSRITFFPDGSSEFLFLASEFDHLEL